MTPEHIEKIFAYWAEQNPQPKTELKYSSEYELLVAVVLSAQATDKSVNAATENLFKVVNTPQQMVDLGVDGLIPYVQSIGLYKNKAKNVVALSAQLLENHKGEVPANRVALEALPGVGRKTANVILNTAFGEPTIAVDTHVFRLANRTGLAQGKTPVAVEDGLLKIVPEKYQQHAHHWLILHGRYVCTARKPKCGECGISTWCKFPDKSPQSANMLENLTSRKSTQSHH
ncbi:MAG: endonuclease III [Gammaproteobacteria bacterium]|nr:endonuclease III [Gammaproteobacteria bacterium]